MRATKNTLVGVRQDKQLPNDFSTFIASEIANKAISNVIKDPEQAAMFRSNLSNTVMATPKLSECSFESVLNAALDSVTFDLNYMLGQYSIVPYNGEAKGQISYKGYATLAVRSGMYRSIGVFDVREGEYAGVDQFTREPVFKWMDDGAERESRKIVGYYGFYELVPTSSQASGIRRSIYWSHEKILKHADTYAPAFKLSIYMKIQNGELTDREVDSLRRGSPWYQEPTSEAHMKMCKKTIIKQMLTDGFAPLSIKMQKALSYDTASERGAVIFANDTRIVNDDDDDVVAEVSVEEKEYSEEQDVQMSTDEANE